MPDTVLPATIQSEINDILRRLTALETFPIAPTPLGTAIPLGHAGDTGSGAVPTNGTMTLLGSAVNTAATGALAFFNDGNSDHFEWMSGTTCPQIAITLAAQSTVMVFGQVGGFFGSGGTASYVQVRAAIMSSSTGLIGANDINGAEMRSVNSYQTNGSGVANATASMAYTMVAGTYYIGWGYRMDAGATTTFTLEWSSFLVFRMG